MNAAGALLVVVGVWVAAQVLKGNALERLGIVTDAVDGGKTSTLTPIPPTGNLLGDGIDAGRNASGGQPNASSRQVTK